MRFENHSAKKSQYQKKPNAHSISVFFASLSAGVGLLALIGWITHVSLLTTYAIGRTPMAPSTSLLLVLSGSALILFVLKPQSHKARTVGLVFGWFSTLVALILLALSFKGIRPGFEHLGFHFISARIGHMSPITAFCFVLYGFSLLGFFLSGKMWQARVIFGLILLSLIFSITLLLGYIVGSPLLYNSIIIPPALPTSIAFLMFGTALMIASIERIWHLNEEPEALSKRTSYLFILFFILASTVIISFGLYFFQNLRQKTLAEEEEEVSTVSKLKMNWLMNWREDYLKDGELLSKNLAFSALVRRYFDKPGDAATQRELQQWINLYPDKYHFDHARLLDLKGTTRLTTFNDRSPIANEIRLAIPGVLRSRQVTFVDFFLCDVHNEVNMAVLVPILDAANGYKPLGVVFLRINPTHLYANVNEWPVPTNSAESLLVRREGDHVLFLSNQRFQNSPPLKLQISLSNKEVPAVKAALGQEGVVEGKDYRVVPVIASLRAIPNSGWFIVSKMDVSEVYAPLKKQALELFTLMGILIVGMGLGLRLIWDNQHKRFYLELIQGQEVLQESEERLRAIMDNATAVVYLKDKEGRYLLVNRHFEKLFNTTNALVQGKTSYDIFPRDVAETFNKSDKAVFQTGTHFETEELVPQEDGVHTYLSLKFPLFSVSGEIYAFCNISTDITGRKRAEEALNEALDRLLKISDQVPGLVYQFRLRPDGSSCMPFASNALNEIFRISPDEVREDASKIFATIYPDDYASVVASIQESAQDLTLWHPEFRVKYDDGTVRWLYGNAVPQMQEDGSVLWHGFVTDITERKQAEEAKALATERLSLATRAGGVGIWDYDVVNDVLHWDNQMYNLYGITQETFGGAYESWRTGLHPEDMAQGDAEIQLALRGEKEFNTEFRVLWPDGSIRNIRALGIVLRDASGQPLRMIGTNWDITERKRAEEVLRESEERFFNAFNYAPIGMALVSPEGHWLKVNQAICDIVGYSDEELITKTFQDITHPDDLESDLAYVNQMLTGEISTYQMEKRYYHKQGNVVWVLLSVSLVKDNQDKPLYFISQVENITEHKLAEEALRESESRLKSAQHVAHLGNWEWDLITNELYWAEENYLLHGIDPEKVKPSFDAFLQVVDPTEHEFVNGAVADALAGRTLFEIDYTVIRPDNGERRIIHSIANVIVDSAGQAVKMIGTVQDITERKQAEEALRESEERWQYALSGAGDGVWDWNSQTNRVFFSPQWKSMLGYTEAEIGDTLDEWDSRIHPDDKKQCFEDLDKHFRGETPTYQNEHRVLCKNGRYKWVLDRGKVIEWTGEGKPLRVIGTHSDISKRKQMESHRQLSAEIMSILNEPVALSDAINRILMAIKQETEFDAVGLRFKNDDDFPYYAQSGFSNDFLLTENTLVIRDLQGAACMNSDGSLKLECICGLVITGQTDPANPLFTAGGSFWTNYSKALLDLPSFQDPRLYPRNRCIHDGYRSVALIPIYANQKIVGLLQLNNRKEDCLTLEMVQFFEGVGNSIGLALLKKQTEEALAISSAEKEYANELLEAKTLELTLMATHDSLTGLHNRYYFDERLGELIKNGSGNKFDSMAVLFLDLDKFKLINDTLGHPVGDLLLVEASKRLQSCLRSEDVLARMGGDEFTCILANSPNRSNVESLASRMIDVLSRPYIFQNHKITCGVSIGIANYPSDAIDSVTLLKFADAAMYKAKQAGRGTFCWFTGDVDVDNQQRAVLEHDLHEALANNQFDVHYQPIVSLEDNSILCAEALLRWKHPEKGMIAPNLFIPIAEEMGLIGIIGDYVLQTACAQTVAWHGEGIHLSRINVNVSIKQIHDAEWLKSVIATLSETGLDAELLNLEVTETDFSTKDEEIIATLHKVRDHGINMAIDDFGKGRSSLRRLKDIPVSHIKIDGSFIRDIEYNQNDNALVRSIVEMSHRQGIKVTAEWVESKTQMEILRSSGCDFIQGYYISPALSTQAFKDFAHEWKHNHPVTEDLQLKLDN